MSKTMGQVFADLLGEPVTNLVSGEVSKPSVDLLNLLLTDKTYATYANAEKALLKACKEAGVSRVRYLIAANEKGRFAPVLVGNQFIPLALHYGITVVS